MLAALLAFATKNMGVAAEGPPEVKDPCEASTSPTFMESIGNEDDEYKWTDAAITITSQDTDSVTFSATRSGPMTEPTCSLSITGTPKERIFAT